jgi:hypothetical protein
MQHIFFNSCLTQVANFLDCFILRKIGSGLTIGFWIHDWGLGILKYQYSILFTFALDQNDTVALVANQNSFDQLFRATLSVQASDQLNELVSRMSLLLTTHENSGMMLFGKETIQIYFSKIYLFHIKKWAPNWHKFIQYLETQRASKV